MSVRRAVAAVAVLVVLVSVGGCAEDEPEPKFAEPTSSSPSPTPTETAEPERESAEDFIRRVTAEANRAQVEGDTTAYRKLAPRCDSCQSFADRVDEIYADGGLIEFAGVEIRSIRFISGSLHGYRVTRQSGPTVVRDAEGLVQQQLPGGRSVVNLYLKRTGRGWLLSRLLRASV